MADKEAVAAVQKQLVEALDQISQCSLIEAMEALDTLLVYTTNLIKFPDEKKYRKVKVTNLHFQERLGHLPGSTEAMAAIGYTLQGDYLRVEDAKAKAGCLAELEAILQSRLMEARRQFSVLPQRHDEKYVYKSVGGAAEHSEIGKRQTMEDDEIMLDCFCGDPNQGFFALYDGHGGRATVDFVVKVLHTNLEKARRAGKTFSDALKDAYLTTDGQLRRQNILRSGSTSVTCVVRTEPPSPPSSSSSSQGMGGEGRRTLYTANVGDSRAVLVRSGVAMRLTVDHKPSLLEEEKRIINAGGFIGRNKRVNGVLAVSRALGDHMLKDKDIVTAVPYCVETRLTDADTHVILACDGVWDVMSDQEAVDLVLNKLKTTPLPPNDMDNGKPKQGRPLNTMLRVAAKALVKEALDRRTLDNVTVMVIALT